MTVIPEPGLFPDPYRHVADDPAHDPGHDGGHDVARDVGPGSGHGRVREVDRDLDPGYLDPSCEGVERGRAPRSLQQIAELFDVVGGEGDAIRQLSSCFTRLLEVQAAKESLRDLSPEEVRAALRYRHTVLHEPTP